MSLDYIKKLEEQVRILFHLESSGHDIHHLTRVLNLALHIHQKEGGDAIVIAISSFLHDIHRIVQKEAGFYCSPKDSLTKVIEIIKKTDLTLSNIQLSKVLHCIEFHEEYSFSESGKTVNDIETLILQDADNLDAIGAIGIARAFSFGGANQMPMWEPKLPFDRKTFDESQSDPTSIHHFKSKLLKLKDNMNTKTAKEIALKRHAYMERFLEEFFAEWNGER